MSLISKPTDLRQKVQDKMALEKQGEDITLAFFNHIEAVSSKNYFPLKEVEELLLKQKQYEVEKMGTFPDYPRDIPKFSPSSAGKCERELFYKAAKAPFDEQTTYSFQNRWTRNSSAIHGATQTMLLDAEILLPNPEFRVMRLDNGLPAWEKPIEKWKVITHNGVQFVLFGMCDGILEYRKDGQGEPRKIGFEYKTKSNSVAQIKQIKSPQDSHISQVCSYSLLFGVDEWLITYESVAKDKWSTGPDARPDFKVFYYKVTDKDRKALLNKLARVAMNLQDGEVSRPDFTKCTFCPYKTICNGVV